MHCSRCETHSIFADHPFRLLIVAFVIALSPIGVSFAGAQEVTIQYVQGRAEVSDSGSWSPVSVGDSLSLRSVIRLQSGSIVSFEATGKQITLSSPGSYSISGVIGMSGALRSPIGLSTLKGILRTLNPKTPTGVSTAMGIRGISEGSLSGPARSYYDAARKSAEAGDYPAAVDSLNRAVKVANAGEKDFLLYYLSYIYMLSGDSQRALSVANHVSPNPVDPWASNFVLLKAQLLLGRFAFDEEVQWLLSHRKLPAVVPRYSGAYYLLLGLGYRGRGDAEKATEYLSRSASTRAENVGAFASSLLAGGGSGQPLWLTSYPSDPRYFYGIGGAPDTGDQQADTRAADKNAREALAQQIEKSESGRQHHVFRDNSAGDPPGVATLLVDGKLDLRLSGLEKVDFYYASQIGYWYYYRLPRTALRPRPKFAGAVRALASQTDLPLELSFGPITEARSGISSSLSLYITDQVFLAVLAQRDLGVRARAPLSLRWEPGEKGKPSSVELSGSFDAPRGGPAAIPITLRLSNPTDGTLVARNVFTIDSASLPAGLKIESANFRSAVAVSRFLGSEVSAAGVPLSVHVWTDRGASATYLDGEPLELRFSATRRCYVKVFHVDADGNIVLVYPNEYAGKAPIEPDRVYRIPERSMPFRFVLGRPFGTEFFEVIASSKPFAAKEAAFAELGRVSTGLIARLSKVRSGGDASTARAVVSYTIVPRRLGSN